MTHGVVLKQDVICSKKDFAQKISGGRHFAYLLLLSTV